VAKNMLEARLKSSKASNSTTMNAKATWSGSMDSYHPYLLVQNFSKNQKILAFTIACPKTQKVVLAAS
jgi:hypothetical protein